MKELNDLGALVTLAIDSGGLHPTQPLTYPKEVSDYLRTIYDKWYVEDMCLLVDNIWLFSVTAKVEEIYEWETFWWMHKLEMG